MPKNSYEDVGLVVRYDHLRHDDENAILVDHGLDTAIILFVFDQELLLNGRKGASIVQSVREAISAVPASETDSLKIGFIAYNEASHGVVKNSASSSLSLFNKEDARDALENALSLELPTSTLWRSALRFYRRTESSYEAAAFALEFIANHMYDGKVILLGRSPSSALLQIVKTKCLYTSPCSTIDLLFIDDSLVHDSAKVDKVRPAFDNINGLCRWVRLNELGDLLKSRVQIAMFRVSMNVIVSGGLHLRNVAGTGIRVQTRLPEGEPVTQFLLNSPVLYTQDQTSIHLAKGITTAKDWTFCQITCKYRDAWGREIQREEFLEWQVEDDPQRDLEAYQRYETVSMKSGWKAPRHWVPIDLIDFRRDLGFWCFILFLIILFFGLQVFRWERMSQK